MAIALDDIITAASTDADNQRKLTSQIIAKNEARVKSADKAAKINRDLGESEYDTTLTKKKADLEVQKANLTNAEILGFTGKNEILSGLLSEFKSLVVASKASEAKVAELDANNDLLSNPMGFLKDLLIGDEIRADNNAIQDRKASLEKDVLAINRMTQQNSVTQNMLKQTLTASSIKEIAKQKQLLAEKDALKAEEDAAAYSIAGLEILKKDGYNELNRQLNIYNLKQQNEDLDFRKRQQEFLDKKYSAETKDEDMRKQIQLEILSNVKTAYSQFGAVPPSDGFILKYFDTQEGEIFRNTNRLGHKINTAPVKTLILGDTPADAVFMAGALGVELPKDKIHPDVIEIVNNTNARYNEVLGKVRTADTASTASTETYGLSQDILSGKDSASRLRQTYNLIAAEEAATYARNFAKKSVPVGGIVEIAPQLKNTYIYKEILEPLSTAGTSSITLTDLVNKVIAKIELGKVSPNVAAKELEELANIHLGLFNTTSGLLSLGAQASLDIPLNVNSSIDTIGASMGLNPYIAFSVSPLPTFTTTTDKIKITDATDMLHYFNEVRAKKIKAQMQQQGRN